MSDMQITPKPGSNRPAQPNQVFDPGELDRTRMRYFLLLPAFAYTVFVIYGSLVPLQFHPHAWEEAWAFFRNIRYLNLGIGSRADWVANILLFIPLAFIWLSVFWYGKSTFWRIAASFFVLVACVGLSIGIEFTQIFFPPRTVSLNDIFAEGIGAIIGIAACWMAGDRVIAWLATWRDAREPLDVFGRVNYLYLFFFFAYNLLPLDLTISPVEIYHKWQQGRVLLIPFSYTFANPVQALYNHFTDILVWVPVGFFWQMSRRKSSLMGMAILLMLPILLEFLQLFVYTRVTDSSDIITGAMGIGTGLWLTVIWRRDSIDPVQAKPFSPSRFNMAPWLWVGAALVWGLIITLVFWYPFDFHIERAFVRERVQAALARAPFEIYYYGTEYRAATEVLHKLLFFAPVGIFLALAKLQIKHYSYRAPASIAFWIFITALAALVEVGQLLLPGKFADGTDWAIETLGGLVGYGIVLTLHQRLPKRSHFNNVPKSLRDIEGKNH